MEIRLDGKTMLITGAGTGLGRATAIEAGASGAFVGVHYHRSEQGAREALEAIKRAGGNGCLLQGDVTRRADVDRIFDQFLAASGGRLDILVNNAGALVKRTAIEDLDEETWNEVIAVNVTSTVNCTRRAIPVMKAQGEGVIINISSIAAATGGGAGAIPYATAKGAINTFTIGLAKELAPFNIRVVALMPGVIPTAFHEKYSSPEQMEKFQRSIPLRRFGKPEDVAAAVVYLASDRAAFITNTFLNISGGW
ncbi:MAG: glucose 1-dehydrogenase [Candidatus Sumerlaeia bacterium]|nr:glucose 1-dehydrogenase [Candidatus Sumerlaeia bacterium]